MGKWSEFKKKLPALQLDNEYQQKVNEEKAQILGLAAGQKANRLTAQAANLAFLGKKMVTARRAKDRLEDKLYDVNLTIEALNQLMRDRMEDEEQEAVELRGGITLGLKDDVYPTIEDQKQFYAWIKATKQVALLSIHFKRFQAVVKDRLAAGLPAPPGAKVWTKTTVVIRGLKGALKNGDEREAA